MLIYNSIIWLPIDIQTLGLAGKYLAPGVEASSDNVSLGVSPESVLYKVNSLIATLV